MTLLVTIVVILAYLSLGIELLFFPVPSVASTYQLSYSPQLSDSGAEFKGALNEVRSWSMVKKIGFLVLPALVNILVFLLPLFLLIKPDMLQMLLPLYEPAFLSLTIGILLVVLGRAITFGSVLKIRKQNTQKASSFHLHDKGFFSLSRNPGLVGMYIMIIGLFIIFPSLYFILGILFYFFYMHFKVKLEEDFLANQFGKAYLQYKTTTKRYL